jgi:hypothetical protein
MTGACIPAGRLVRNRCQLQSSGPSDQGQRTRSGRHSRAQCHRGPDLNRELGRGTLRPDLIVHADHLSARHDLEPIAPIGASAIHRHVDHAAVGDVRLKGLVVGPLTRGRIRHDGRQVHEVEHLQRLATLLHESEGRAGHVRRDVGPDRLVVPPTPPPRRCSCPARK